LIWGKREAEYFWKWDWTGQIRLIPKENFSSTVIPGHREAMSPESITIVRMDSGPAPSKLAVADSDNDIAEHG
jgi:hypothetical protein